MSNQIISVNFNNQSLLTTLVDNVPHVALKPICESLGLDWASQLKRIKRHPVLNQVMVMITTTSATGADGKSYMVEMAMMPIKFLNGWLFGIDSSRVKTEAKELVVTYQRECFDVLANHFMPKPYGLKELKPTYASVKMERHVSEMVNYHAAETGKHYNTVYDEIKTKFEFQKIGEIPVLTYPEICTYFGKSPKYDIPRTIVVDILDAGKAEKYQTLLQIERGELKALPAQELQALENKSHSFIKDYNHFREYLDENSEMGYCFVRKSDLCDLGMKLLDMGI